MKIKHKTVLVLFICLIGSLFRLNHNKKINNKGISTPSVSQSEASQPVREIPEVLAEKPLNTESLSDLQIFFKNKNLNELDAFNNLYQNQFKKIQIAINENKQELTEKKKNEITLLLRKISVVNHLITEIRVKKFKESYL